jgi:hypothetical protein
MAEYLLPGYEASDGTPAEPRVLSPSGAPTS